jgi:pyruvate/2-oxoglutarate/acetoin dehydrogenase E1 component
MKYSEAINLAILHSMQANEKMLVLGQGVWSPFYVGQTMDGIEQAFGRHRVIDTPVSENAITGIALGAAIAGSTTLVIHPRMDFMILAMDPIVNAAAKWRYALDWPSAIPLTIRTIINRGGEQGAQHSQSLQSWFTHIPGLRVAMPSNPQDAYYLLRSCIDSPDPCIFVEDRWDYSQEEDFVVTEEIPILKNVGPKILKNGSDLTLVSYGHAVNQCLEAAQILQNKGIEVEVIDLRILSPMSLEMVYESVLKTGKLAVVEETWAPSSVGSEVLSKVSENVFSALRKEPLRINLPFTPAPTSPKLEERFYFSAEYLAQEISQKYQSNP